MKNVRLSDLGRWLACASALVLLVSLALPATARGGAMGGDPDAGKASYDIRCAVCHGMTGKGDGPGAAALNPKPRNHTDGIYMNAKTNDELFAIIKKGGVSAGLSPLMPPWEAQMTDQDIKNVIAYIRTLATPVYLGN